MTSERPSESSAHTPATGQENAHILFLDVVGFSRLSDADQAHILTTLPSVVYGSVEFRQANNRGEVISLPRGDGMALVFLGDIFPAVRTAIEIAQELRARHQFRVRMGLNSGPVTIIRDINDNMDVAGDGIVLAQRAMDAGDAEHILLTDRAAALVLPRKAWAPYLHDLGVIPAKHGVPLRLYSLHTKEVGNSSPPRALLQHYAKIAENKRSRVLASPRTWRDAVGDMARVGWLTLLAGISLFALVFAFSPIFRETVFDTLRTLADPKPAQTVQTPNTAASGSMGPTPATLQPSPKSIKGTSLPPDNKPSVRFSSSEVPDSTVSPPDVRVRVLQGSSEPDSEQTVEIVVRVGRDGLGSRPVRVECGADLDSLTILGEQEAVNSDSELRYETNHVGERIVVAVTYYQDQRHFLGTWSLASGKARREPDG